MDLLVKMNPFYNYPKNHYNPKLEKLELILKNISPEKTIEENDTNIKEIINILCLKDLFADNFKNIFIYGLTHLSRIFSSENCSKFVLMIMILFLVNPNRKTIKNEKINFLQNIINTSREEIENINTKEGNKNFIHFGYYKLTKN